jgi:hypothetical protein
MKRLGRTLPSNNAVDGIDSLTGQRMSKQRRTQDPRVYVKEVQYEDSWLLHTQKPPTSKARSLICVQRRLMKANCHGRRGTTLGRSFCALIKHPASSRHDSLPGPERGTCRCRFRCAGEARQPIASGPGSSSRTPEQRQPQLDTGLRGIPESRARGELETGGHG